MFKKSVLLCLFILTLATACNNDKESENKEYIYRVVGIKDGDTMVLLSPDHIQTTVRLAEIDCPEKSQAFGQAAKQFTSDLCFGKQVKLFSTTKDRYGRTVGQVELADGTNVNYAIVKGGYAWQYRAYSKSMALAELELRARQNHLGLWQDVNPTPPWNFRKEGKTNRVQTRAPKTNKPKRHYKKRKPKYADTASVQFKTLSFGEQ
ncbi:thermonuclease family protein [Mucilaginibacter sp. ZT4R22]|uniref:Thermonuclease family protein n=1 Tax=Mucilaginibacter pankratovii TaxID=2772110 RepID=A0ABR7WXM0_9SPHI|nr:thermonuclease family protein [Mucilaginibacter pankratovii]MBD1367041.1 thermonuclease family protein [Mucilaginibacter pankratovii]